MKAPCAFTPEAAAKGPQAGLRLCSAYFNGEGGRPGLIANMKALMITHVDKELARPTNTGVQTCVVAPNPLVLKNGAPFPEDRFNRAGVSCGNRMRVTTAGRRPVVIQFHKEPPATGTLEDGWIAGSQYQAIAYYLNEVGSQITSAKKFTARNYNTSSSSRARSYAADMARDYNQLFEDRNKLYEIISARTDTKELLAAIADCKKAEDGSDPNLTFTVGQQAAQLCSAQMSLERAYMNIAVVEIMGRAENSFYEKFAEETAYLRFLDRIQKDLKDICFPQGRSRADACYNENITAKMQSYFQTAWPLPPSMFSTATQTASLENATPWFLMFAALRRRKKLTKARRRRARSRSTPNALRRLLRALSKIAGVALMGAWFAGGCGGGQTAATTPTQLITGTRPGGQGACPWGAAVGTYKVECCAPDGSLCDTEGKAGCNVVCRDIFTIADGPIKASIITGADDIGATRTSLDNAAVLLGVPLEAINSGGGPDGSVRSAALAGAKLGAGGNLNLDGESVSTDTTGATARTGGDGPGPGSQSGSTPGSIFGNKGGAGLSLAGGGGAGADGSKDAASAGADGKGGKGDKYGGAGGRPGEVGAMDGNGLFGDLAGGDRALAGQDTAFGKPLDGTNPMGSSDPDDYFTRVGLDESIFRIVSRRYRAKAFTWATVQSQASFQEATRASSKK